MRKSTLSAAEIAEMDEMKTKEFRQGGLDLMPIRDAGGARLRNGTVVEWAVAPNRRKEGALYPNIPDGCFILTIDGKKALFNGEEFRKFLRWV